MSSSPRLINEFLRSAEVTVDSRTAAAMTVRQHRQNQHQPTEELARPRNCPQHSTDIALLQVKNKTIS